MSKRPTKYVSFAVANDYSTFTKEELLHEIDKAMAYVPADAVNVKFEIEHIQEHAAYTGQESHSAQLTISFYRPETEAETNERMANQQTTVQRIENQERAELQRLTKKYGK